MLPVVTDMEKGSLRGASGFTIIELVIVMSLMIILTGIVAPHFEMSAARRVEGMSRQMVRPTWKWLAVTLWVSAR